MLGKRIFTSTAAALAAAGFFAATAGINHHTKRDGSRLHEAELKRARKNAKRLGINCPHRADISEGKCTACGYTVYGPIEL